MFRKPATFPRVQSRCFTPKRWARPLVAGLTLCLAAPTMPSAQAADPPPDGGAAAQTPAPDAVPSGGTAAQTPSPDAAQSGETLPTVEVRSRVDLLGTAATASQGTVTQQEIDLRPAYRVGQVLETVPGLMVTVHSGEGKANQYFIRGFNLDHGTDFATYVDDMPVNEPTNAHGQGYTDIHFLMPELAAGIDYTKGPFYANIGDFGALGSAHVRLLDEIPTQVSVTGGMFGTERVFMGGTAHFDNGDRLLGAFAFGHYNGPWTNPDDYQSYNGTARYTHGDQSNGFDLTAMAYRGTGNFTTDQPVSANQQGLIGRFGSLDPTDGNYAERFSLSGHYYVSGDDWKVTTSAYVIHYHLTLWNDFTHYLDDPVHGDQEQQDENRTTAGGQTVYQRFDTVMGLPTETQFGLSGRYDSEYIDRRHTEARVALPNCPGFGSDEMQALSAGRYFCVADQVTLGDVAVWGSNTTHWLPWLRTVAGLRLEDVSGTDHSLLTGFNGSVSQFLPLPSGSLIFGPWHKTELYLSMGQGFHSNDLRGVLGTVPTLGVPNPNQTTPLLTKITSEEIGIRSDIVPNTTFTGAVFREYFASFLTYDADIGANAAGPPAELDGIELSAQVRPYDWLELNADVNFTHSRYSTTNLAQYGLVEPYNGGLFIPNAPAFIGSFGAIWDNIGPWFGGIEFRWLGAQPLVSDNSLRTAGYRVVNLEAGYKVNEHIKLRLGLYNLFNATANASQYAYEYQVSPTAAPEFGATYHPIEPFSARLTLTATF